LKLAASGSTHNARPIPAGPVIRYRYSREPVSLIPDPSESASILHRTSPISDGSGISPLDYKDGQASGGVMQPEVVPLF